MCYLYLLYDFRVGNNVLETSQLVFTSRELVKKKGAPVGEWLATFTLFPLSPVQKTGNNGIEKLLSTPDRVSCTNYFMSIEIIRCSVRWIETTKPDKKNNLWPNHIVSFQYDAANANKSCVRVHGGQSSEFPIYPTTRERGISPIY